MKKILILYSELAGYTVACLNRFKQSYPDTEIHLVSWPVNPEAPFKFRISNEIVQYNRRENTQQSLISLMNKINPDLILCSGWMDKDYLAVVKKRPSKCKAVLLMDNRWSGSLKQRVATFIAPFFLTNAFDFAWVPGDDQKQYALRLGFDNSDIETGFYSGDTELFKRKQPYSNIPHRFVYAGRYYDFKGVNELWREFIEFSDSTGSDWELWCFGIGDVEPIQHPKIKHFGFQQPDQLAASVAEGGVFVLPSKFEPWGVVVHEFAAAGFPLLLSNEVGAAARFLKDGINGYRFNTLQSGELAVVFRKISALSQEQLFQMSEVSATEGASVNPETWSKTLFSFLNRK
jgi:hypothetical protein